jgi:hypothetical protein
MQQQLMLLLLLPAQSRSAVCPAMHVAVETGSKMQPDQAGVFKPI